MQHKLTEEYVDMIQSLVHIEDRHLFRVMLLYYYGVIASTQHATITSENFGTIPLNVYANVLAPSGFGKNVTIKLIKDYIFNPFYDNFNENVFQNAKHERFKEIFPMYKAEMTVGGSITPPSEADINKQMNEDYALLGSFLPFFGNATEAAIRQLSAHVQMTGCNSINFVCDEIGSKLAEIKPTLTNFLQLYDVGEQDNKALKNYKDSSRMIDLKYPVPANMLLFGEPNLLLNGSENQKMYMELLMTGFARRVLFACVETKPKIKYTPEELYSRATSSRKHFKDTSYWADLGTEEYYRKDIKCHEEQALKILAYSIDCNHRASEMKSHQLTMSTELEHRYFRVLKAAGTLAFIDKVDAVTNEHIDIAISIAEESGESFKRILNRPDSYELVLRYLEENEGIRLTKADIHKHLPCFKGSQANQNNLVELATALGYTKNSIVSKTMVNGVEFLSVTKLEPTNLEEITISYSNHPADNYLPRNTSFDKLKEFVKMKGFGFCNHHFVGNHRSASNVLEGFNMIVLDIDGTSTLDRVRAALANFKYIIYTSKSHKEDEHHFRVLLPISHRIKLDAEKFSEFMVNVYRFMPFTVDEVTKDASRMWYTNEGDVYVNDNADASLLPATWFIPNTRDNETMIKDLAKYHNNGIVRYFAKVSKFGVNRNNNLYKYARFLIDCGYTDMDEVIKKVQELNAVLDDPIDETELNATVFKSIAKLFV